MELPRAAAKGTAPQPKMVKQLKNGLNHAKRYYTWLAFIVRGAGLRWRPLHESAEAPTEPGGETLLSEAKLKG